MDWFSVCFFYGFVTVIQVILQLSFMARFTGRKFKRRHYISGTVFLYLMVAVGTFAGSSLLCTVLNMLVLYGESCILLRNKAAVSGLAVTLIVSIMQLCFGFVNTLESFVQPYVKAGTSLPLLLAVMCTLCSLALCYICYHFIESRFTLHEDSSSQYISIVVAPILLICVLGFYILNTAYGNSIVIPLPAEPKKHIELLILESLGFGAIFSTLYGYQKLCESFRAKTKLTLLEQETRAQKAYVMEAKMRYGKTQAFRHDIKNHLCVLDGFLSAGKSEQAKAYLKKLESVTGELSFSIQTGNPVVDMVVGSKSELAAQKEIKIESSLFLPDSCAVDDLDLCIIFSNAMDNAINACDKISGSRSIRITGEQQGDFFMLEFINSCLPDKAASCPFGTGLSNIKAAAEKYNGAITIEKQAAEFRLNVLINIS